MALAPRIEVRQSQTLAMSPQLQQAIKLLQLNNLALAEFVAAEVEKNPLLEIAPPPGPAAQPRIAASAAPGPGPDGLDAIAAQVGLIEYLLAQIGAMRAPAEVLEAARLIAEELEEDGYLRVPLTEVAARHRLGPAAAAGGLALVQGCDPPGVGGRSLAECLALQLRDRNRFDPAMAALLDHLPMIPQGRHGELAALCGVDAEDLADMLAELRALDPKPGLRFGEAPVQVAVPDVYVLRLPEGGWGVELNTETLPRVLVNNRYAASLAGADREARQFVSEMRAAANWLARSLEQRARTILRVVRDMARHQEAFFDAGPRRLRPLTQRMVADRLALHESTISRVTAGKFLACDQGLFELRYFFSPVIQSVAGGEGFSAVAVQDRLRQLIAAEDTSRPLSDDKIVTVLHAEGIDIARRTVAKYREEMGIPSSVQRRRHRTAVTA